MNEEKETFMLGDFNKDLLNSNWTDYMYSQCLINMLTNLHGGPDHRQIIRPQQT